VGNASLTHPTKGTDCFTYNKADGVAMTLWEGYTNLLPLWIPACAGMTKEAWEWLEEAWE